MSDLLIAGVAAAGVVLLALLLVLVAGPVRRFTRARGALRAGVTDRVAVLRAVAAERHPVRRRGST